MKWIFLLSVLLILAAGGAGYLAFVRYTAVFPELQPGLYVGMARTEAGRSFPWAVGYKGGESTIAIVVGDARIPAERVAPLEPMGRARLPLIVGKDEARLRFTGTKVSGNEYAGEFMSPVSGEQGTWGLQALYPEAMAPGLENDLIRWASMWQELDRMESEIQGVQQKVDEQRAAIDNLNRYVEDGDTLKKTADIRLGRSDSELEAAKSELASRQQQLDRDLRDFDLTQRVSPEGKLVFLARETIQRESRWIDLTLQLLAPETSPGFDQALERAERIRFLQRQITEEREAIVRQGEAERYKGGQAITKQEEEFYGQLQ